MQLLIQIALLATVSYGFKQLQHNVARHNMISSLHAAETDSIPLTTSNELTQGFKSSISIFKAMSIFALTSRLVNAAETTDVAVEAEKKPTLGPPPTDFGLSLKDYYADVQRIVNHMRYAVQLEKGDPNLAMIAEKTKNEMTEFVSFYRRFNGINGKQSFSLLYTSINVLAGHYTSYGVKFPVPEKRKKRLLQEFNDVEKNIRKKR